MKLRTRKLKHSPETLRVAIDRLGDLVDSMHDTARAMHVHKHGPADAYAEAADLISDFRKELQEMRR